MKLATVERPIDRIATNTERQFTIKATGKAFRILSSGLYKEKILAIVRELSCNAYDAHVSAGWASRPFDVHLPNSFEPYFAVRDYGPALSPDQINNVFTTYFESTKTDSNDQIGGLGLGCKSPLSYVDSFMVISRREGLKRTYTVFFDESDTPAIVLMDEEETTEPAGLEVRLAVESSFAYREFKDKAQQVYRYFDPHPNVIGSGEYKPQAPDVVLRGLGYQLVRGGHDARAIMGVVAYPLDAHAVTLSSVGRDLINNTSIDIEFGVGELDVTAGREELSYDKRTKETITTRVDKILSDLHRRVIRDMTKCQNEFEARRYYGQVLNSFSVIKRLFPNAAIPFKGDLIDSGMFTLNLRDKWTAITALHYDFSGQKPRYGTINSETMRDLVIPANDRTTLIIDDLNGRQTTSRIRQFHDDNPDADVWVIRCNNPEQLIEFKGLFDGVTPILTSTLAKAPVEPRQPTSVLKLCDYNKRGGTIKRDSWERTSVNPAEGGVFVRTISGSVHNDAGMKVSNFDKFYHAAVRLGLFKPSDEELYSIPKSLSGDFSADDGWVDFFTLVREQFTQQMVEQKWGEDIAKSRAMKNFSNQFSGVSGERGLFEAIVAKLAPGHRLQKFLKVWNECQIGTDFTLHTSMSDTLNIPIPVLTSHDLSKAWLEAAKGYPMLEYVWATSRWSRVETEVIRNAKDYIEAIDRNCVPTKV